MAVHYKPNLYVHSDYSQWERKGSSTLEYQGAFSQLSALSLADKSRPKDHQGTTACHVKNQVDHVPTRLIDSPSYRLLNVKENAMVIKKRQTLEQYRNHLLKLEGQNMELIQAIQSTDKNTHNVVSHSLDKYHRFKGVLTKVKQIGTSEIKETSDELEELQSRVKTRLAKLHDEVHSRNVQLQRCTNQLHTLVNYKEKDYPLKQVKIEQLQMNLDYLDELQQREETELEESLQEERSKFDRKMDEIRLQLEAEASKDWLTQMKTDVFAQAVHSKVMEKELDLQNKTQEQLLGDIERLKYHIQNLMNVTGIRYNSTRENPLLLSPLSRLGKCTPETEISLVLDFPTNHELPV